MGPNQTYKLLHSKGNNKQKEKTTYRMGENICKQCDQEGRDLQNIQTAHTTQQKKKKKKANNPIEKWAEDLSSKEEIQSQEASEKLLSITNY